MPNVTLTFALD